MNNRIITVENELTNSTAALILSSENIFYLSKVKLDDGVMLITDKKALLFADSRYFEYASKHAVDCEVVLLKNCFEQINKYIKLQNISELLIESDFVTVSKSYELKKNLNVKINETNNLCKTLKEMRAVKDDEELKNIIAAQEITDKTFLYICERITHGRTEKEIMLDMEFYSRKIGSNGVSFDFIVVSGKNTSLPHGIPSEKQVNKGDFVTLDFGATINGYRSDMTRTVAVGDISNEQKSVYDTVLKAQKAAISFAAAGKKCSDVDKIARDIINTNGYEGYFGHALGHGVGIDIHEAPSLSPKSTHTLKAGNVVTVEPGIYIPDKFGVRIEDMLYITDNGNLNLTKSTKELIML